jgi:hypothetical protein
MAGQNWLNADGLFLQYGTDKTVPEVAGEFRMPGANRVIEVLIDLTTLTSTAAIQSNTEIFPDGANIYIEKVEVTAEVGAATGTSFSVGLIQMDRATIPTNYSTALINAEVTATVATAGMSQTYYQNTTHAGGLIGSFPAAATGPYYITALSAGSTYTTGKMRVRVYYHGVGTITQ